MAKVDAPREIRRAVDTGKVGFGARESEKSLKNGSAKLIIIAKNAPRLSMEKLVSFAENGKTPHFVFEGNGIELGSVCGKPFAISAMVIEDAGKSRALELSKE